MPAPHAPLPSAPASASGVPCAGAVARRDATSQRAGGCACVLGGLVGVRCLYGSPDVCGGDGSHAFGRLVRPSTQVLGKGGAQCGYKVIEYGEERTLAKHSKVKRDAACGSSALSGMRRGFLERVPSMS